MSKPNLKLVPAFKKQPKPHDATYLAKLRAAMLHASAQFVNHHEKGSRNDRIREASDATGISRSQIENASDE